MKQGLLNKTIILSIAFMLLLISAYAQEKKTKPKTPEISSPDSTYIILNQVLSSFDSNFGADTQNVALLPLDSTGMPSDSILKTLMASMNQHTPFDFVFNYEVKKFLKLYYLKRKSFLERVSVKSQYYFPFFEKELDKRNLPLELKYLAIIESALNPNAISRAGAGGLWQFMPRTGAHYDLRINNYYDQRQDPYLATIAACEHLEDLYNIYDDWTLALAAYNSGTGNVNKAIRYADGKTNYWKIMSYLPSETRGYVPAFIAVAHLMENNEIYGIEFREAKEGWFDTDTITLFSKIEVSHLSKLLSVDKETIEHYNPSIQNGLIAADSTHPFNLRLPKDLVYTYMLNKDSILQYVALDFEYKNQEQKMNLEQQQITYRVRSGDNLGRIAQKHHCRVSELKRWNHLRSDRIYAGQKLIVYSNKSPSSSSKSKVANNLVYQGEKKDAKYYVVKKGDTLWDIANKYSGLSIEKLKAMNQISNENKLKLGQKLIIGYAQRNTT